MLVIRRMSECVAGTIRTLFKNDTVAKANGNTRARIASLQSVAIPRCNGRQKRQRVGAQYMGSKRQFFEGTKGYLMSASSTAASMALCRYLY